MSSSRSTVASVASLVHTLKHAQTYDYLRASTNADLTRCLLACAKEGQPTHAREREDAIECCEPRQGAFESVLSNAFS